MKNLYFLTVCFLCFYACERDECKGREDRSLNTSAVNSIPYLNGQTYNFKSNEGDEISVWVERIEQTLVPDFPLICEGYLELRLKKPDRELFIDIIMRGSIQSDLVQLSIFKHGNENGVIAQFQVNEDGTYTSILPHESYTFHDRIEIDSVNYDGVIELRYPDLLEENDVDKVYYNADIGLIKVLSNSGYSISLM